MARCRLAACAAALLGAMLLGSLPGQAAEFRLLKLDGHLVKWGTPEMGTPAGFTWSFTDREISFADAINCGRMSPMRRLSERSGIAFDEIRAAFETAFALWEGVAGIDIDYVERPSQADVLVGVQAEPRGIAFANLWHEEVPVDAPADSVASLTRGAICLNPRLSWETVADGNRDTYQLLQVAAHEIGHIIGLDHPGRSGALMGFRYEEASPGLRDGDVVGARLIYGER